MIKNNFNIATKFSVPIYLFIQERYNFYDFFIFTVFDRFAWYFLERSPLTYQSIRQFKGQDFL